jgi:WNK lysine deficient protein kinase
LLSLVDFRYTEVVGKGRFKQIFKAFDTQIGIDVAWSKISAEPHHLSDEQLQQIVAEMTKVRGLWRPLCAEQQQQEQQGCAHLHVALRCSC